MTETILCASPQVQQPAWPDAGETARVTAELRSRPGLVDGADCDRLRAGLVEVSAGRAFVLQGGDCAETFVGNTLSAVRGKLALLTAMSARVAEAGLPVVTIGRIAGQYGKPRSSPVESRGGAALPAYRGDAVNDVRFTAEARTPDPRRMLKAYDASAAALAALDGRLFTSHEALLLDYEAASIRGRYATSGHLLWIGERTRQPHGAHVELLTQVDNPVAVKIGPQATAEEVLQLVGRLDPLGLAGRLILIARMGADAVRTVLPPLLAAIHARAPHLRWMCDPMHGNTVLAGGGFKTRHLDAIIDELTGFFEVHRAFGVNPGGVHLELTAEPVTECLGGTPEIRPEDLPRHYRTACDPRLNHEQSLQIASVLSELLAKAVVDRGVRRAV